MQNPSNLVWVDMEMTGLIPDEDVVIEIATIVTDSELNTLAEGPVIALHQSDTMLAGMDEWNTTHHTRSGLVERVRASHYDEQRATFVPVLESVAEAENVSVMPLVDVICDEDFCSGVKGSELLFLDGDHLSKTGGLLLTEMFRDEN
jgi:oligoribonuclease (3'-5' exoribonuclease)